MIDRYIIDASPRFRSMTLLVRPDGIPCVWVPRSYDPDIVDRFIRNSEAWIGEQRRVLAMPSRATTHTGAIGDRKVRCTITSQARRKKPAIYVHEDGNVEVRIPEGMGADQVIPLIEHYKDEIRSKLEKGCEAPGISRSVTWNGTVIPYTIRHSDRARRVSIRVLDDRSVEVVAPVTANADEVEHMVSERAEWIHRQVTNDARPVAMQRKFCDGETFPFLGGTLTVRVIRGRSCAQVLRDGPFIRVWLPDGVSEAKERAIIRQAVAYTLKEETSKAVIPVVSHYAALFGVPVPPPPSVRETRRRWGSCIGRRRLTFSSAVCMLPPRLFEYVVAHEVCHMVVMDHSDNYWETFRTVMPDCREREAELRRDTPLYRLPPA